MVKDTREGSGRGHPGGRGAEGLADGGQDQGVLYGNYDNSQRNWHLLLPQNLCPNRKEGMADQGSSLLKAWLRGSGIGVGEHWTALPPGQEDTSMMLIIQRHASRLKPSVLMFLTVREGRGGKKSRSE